MQIKNIFLIIIEKTWLQFENKKLVKNINAGGADALPAYFQNIGVYESFSVN